MNSKRVVRNLLLALALGSVLYMIGSEYAGRREAASQARSAAAPVAVKTVSDGLVVYYFSQGKECVTCDQIESFSHEALEKYFPAELASGRIVWQSVDVDEPRNEHFVTDYSLYTKSVVIVDMKGGAQIRWKNLDKVWDLVNDKPAFMEYVRKQVQDYLATAP